MVRRGCESCLEYLKIVPRINLKLPIEKRIRIMDNFKFDEFGVKTHLIQNRLDKKDKENYPILFLDGIIVIGGMWAEQLKHFLDSYLKEDYLV